MGILDRIILTIYTCLLTFLSAGVILLSLRLVSLDWVRTSIESIAGRWEAGLVGAVFLLVSLRLLLAGVRSSRGGRAIIQHTELGDVEVSLTAVENLVEKTVRHIRGVRGVKVAVGHANSAVSIGLKIVASPETNIPEVTAEIQQRVSESLKDTIGIEPAGIRVRVANIANDLKAKRVE
ncbi:MAG: alkaline shock response membrane anchor protein AmaP [Sporomusaceae bacterium]|nr:alkaline shock response membrane anchor protein AmaP [Sporomusaceae bacterium]